MTPCPRCGGALERVEYSGGWMNRDQWEASRAGDWCCTRCPPEAGTAGRARTGWAYFWDRDVMSPERLRAGCEAFSRFLIWVAVEAMAQRGFDRCRRVLGYSNSVRLWCRQVALAEVVRAGLLRLEWPR